MTQDCEHCTHAGLTTAAQSINDNIFVLDGHHSANVMDVGAVVPEKAT